MILWTQGDLLKIRIVAGNAVGEHQGAASVDPCLKAGQTVRRESISASGNSTAVSSGIRRESYEVQPVSENQPDTEDTGEEPRKDHGLYLSHSPSR